MVQPINYILDVQTPFEAATAGFKVGLAGQEAQAQRQLLEAQRAKAVAEAEKLRQDQERMRKNNEAVQLLLANPTATAQQYREVASTLPEDQRKFLKDSFDSLTKEEQDSQLQFGGQVMSALVGKKPDIAIDLLTTRAQRERNAGREDKAKATESTIEMMRLNPDNAMHILGISMAGVPGFDKVLETATAAVKPEDKTNLQREYDFIKQTLGPNAAADLLKNRADPLVNITFDDGTQYIGSRSYLERTVLGIKQEPAPSAQAMQPGQAAPTGQAAKPETQKGVDFILNEAMKKRRIDQSTVNVLKQSFGAEGQTQLNKWLLDNNVRVVVRRGYDKSTGQSVVEFSDGKVEYGTD